MSDDNIIWLAPDYFKRNHKPRASRAGPRKYKVVWPCGASWVFTRHNLRIPVMRRGEMTGGWYKFRSVKEATYCLEDEGCIVEVDTN